MGEVIDIKDIWTNVMIENAIDDIKTTGNEMLAAVLQDSMDLVQTGEEIKIYAGFALLASMVNGIVKELETNNGYSYEDIDPDWYTRTKMIALVE